MKNKIIRTFTVTLAAVLCLTAFSTTAFAGGTDPNPEPLPETTEAPQEEEPTTGGMEPESVPVTPEGNATLVDDFYGDKQLITVTTKAGNYFTLPFSGSLWIKFISPRFTRRTRTSRALRSEKLRLSITSLVHLILRKQGSNPKQPKKKRKPA